MGALKKTFRHKICEISLHPIQKINWYTFVIKGCVIIAMSNWKFSIQMFSNNILWNLAYSKKDCFHKMCSFFLATILAIADTAYKFTSQRRKFIHGSNYLLLYWGKIRSSWANSSHQNVVTFAHNYTLFGLCEWAGIILYAFLLLVSWRPDRTHCVYKVIL
jgi:hypothetical protein